ncbi:innexin shaking-B [Nephila pilipes]|uniref:Innexin n=1 Tax=Nephila pilipes TaxID=299642 RepID=A0A8X6P173_NEPPI|nr:innexin shaking-B [Nephila pilipes]
MFNIVKNVGAIVQIEETKIDYQTFRLHYICTVGFLLVFFIVITVSQIVGDPIFCESQDDTRQAINSYCWMHSTYVIPKAFFKEVGKDVPHPGVDGTQDPKEFFYLTYYQWVFFILFFQAVCFYIPRLLWITWEGGKMKTLTKDMNNVLLPEPEFRERFLALRRYLVKTWTAHDVYAAKYFFCELLTLINVVLQFFLLDLLFNGKYLDFGVRIIKFYTSAQYIREMNETQSVKGDPLIMLFPRVTKCIFRKFGKTSTIEIKDFLCIMSLNAINEKIFVFLWFWFLLLAVLTIITLLMDYFLMVSPVIRAYALQTRFYLVDHKAIKKLVRKGSFGDWLILDMIGQNIDHSVFRDLVPDVAKGITEYYKKL